MPLMKPHSKGVVFQVGFYLSVRGALPGSNRVGTIFLLIFIEKGKQHLQLARAKRPFTSGGKKIDNIK